MLTLFMITARVPIATNDGRDPAVFWGYESQFYTVRKTAEVACRRLQAGAASFSGQHPEYGIAEVTRASFASDEFGAQEWRNACHQAGVDPRSDNPPK
jgi:hypothetical protein